MIEVIGDVQLQEFRRSWTGRETLDLLAEHGGRLRVSLAVGVGKTRNLDDTMEEALRSGKYDLVVVLVPTRRLLSERRVIREPPEGIRVVNLRPRPRGRCGPELDAPWLEYEAAGLGTLGRVELCDRCPKRQGCFWPKQYGAKMQGAKVVIGTQTHLERSPFFIQQLQHWTGAERVLVLLDEVNFLMRSCQKQIRHDDLKEFVEVLYSIHLQKRGTTRKRWRYLAELLLDAPTEDLRCSEWRTPYIGMKWSVAVQSRGRQLHSAFRFLAYDLQQFGYSPLESRMRDSQGNIHFSAPPYLGCDFVVYSGTASTKFAKYRLGKEFASPFDGYVFQHPETRWYNIASRLGARRYFYKNADQILDFFAGLVSRRIQEGKRPLLVVKKIFATFCQQEVERRLHEHGLTDARVVYTKKWEDVDLRKPSLVPLITYGLIGTNLFEEFDCAYCISAYYVNEKIVNKVLQDVLALDEQVPIRIVTGGNPRRRTAQVVEHRHRYSNVHTLAPLALEQQEMDKVLQAVGRVRPYTRAREIITFQCAAHPQLPYTQEFHTLGQAREFFGIATRRERSRQALIARIQQAKCVGQTPSDVAKRLDVSLRTVRRYWNP